MKILSKREQVAYYRELMTTRRGNRRIFSCGYAERFDPFLFDRRPALASVFERMFSDLFPTPVGRLLDVGCGSGFYLPLLARCADEVVGFDLSPEMIEGARAVVSAKGIANVRLFVGDAEEIDLPDGSFDALLCFDVLHHIPDLPRALREMHRVLRPAGRFAAIEPNALNPAVFVAHAMPAEERGALRRNWPWRYRSTLSPYFEGIRVRFINYIASSPSEGVTRVLNRVDSIMARTPLRALSMRQIVTASRRGEQVRA